MHQFAVGTDQRDFSGNTKRNVGQGGHWRRESARRTLVGGEGGSGGVGLEGRCSAPAVGRELEGRGGGGKRSHNRLQEGGGGGGGGGGKGEEGGNQWKLH